MESGANDSDSDAPETSDPQTYLSDAPDGELSVIHPSPIGNLSLDLFIIIIRLVLHIKSSDYSHHFIQNLRLVCKRWCQVLDSTPYFWSIIHSAAPPTWIVASLERSKNLPLTIHHTMPQFVGATSAYKSFTALLVPQSQRWKRFSIVLTGLVNLPLLQTYNAPNLKTLWLSGPRVVGVPKFDFEGHTPRLRSVYLNNYSIPWTSAIFRSGTLRYLALVGLTFKVPTATELCNIFANSPRLRVIEVSVSGRLVARAAFTDSTASLHPIHLPRLTRLCMNVEPRVLYGVLPRLHMPACTRLKVGMERFTPRSLTDMPGLVQHLVSRLLDLAGNLTVKATSWCSVIGHSGRMDLHSIGYPEDLITLLTAYAAQTPPFTALPPSITTLICSPSQNISTLIAALCVNEVISKSIDRIVINMGDAQDQDVLQCLSIKSPTGWPCPHLAGVELAYCPERAAGTRAFVEARCNGALGQAVRLHLTSAEHRPDEQMQEFIRTHELVDFEWKGGDVVPGIGLEL